MHECDAAARPDSRGPLHQLDRDGPIQRLSTDHVQGTNLAKNNSVGVRVGCLSVGVCSSRDAPKDSPINHELVPALLLAHHDVLRLIYLELTVV